MLLYFVLTSVASTSARADLVFVYSVERHGARNILPKTALLKEDPNGGGPDLLPQGEAMCHSVGVHLILALDDAICEVGRIARLHPTSWLTGCIEH